MRTLLSATIGRMLLVSALSAIACAAQATVITFEDTEFNLASYSAPLIFSTGAVASNISQTLNGNPGSALETSLRASGPFQFSSGVVRNSFAYDPAAYGAVSTISVSIDRIASRTINGIADIVATYTLRPLILQGGKYFQAVSPPISGTDSNNENVWVTLSLVGLGADDFGLYDFATGGLDTSINPDFGESMTFGFISATFGTGGMVSTFATTGSDNWRVTLQTVPEPSTVALVALCLAGLTASLRRKR